MKKYFAFLYIMFSLFWLFPFSAFAYDWPPEEYEMPRTVLTTEGVKESLSGLRDSIRSIANTGLVILGICLSVFLIPLLLNRLVLENLSFRRKTQKASSSSERMESVDAFGISGKRKGAGLAWQDSSSSLALEERLYQRESSYSSDGLPGEAQKAIPHRRQR